MSTNVFAAERFQRRQACRLETSRWKRPCVWRRFPGDIKTLLRLVTNSPAFCTRILFGGGLVASDEEDDAIVYAVVINYEEQYSIWPSQKALPRGWRAVGKQGSKADCLKYIDEVWTDMRPASLRQMAEKPSSKK